MGMDRFVDFEWIRGFGEFFRRRFRVPVRLPAIFKFLAR